jgi:hypothetical protein
MKKIKDVIKHKTNNTSTELIDPAAIVKDEYLCYETFRVKPITENLIHRWCYDLEIFAQKQTSLCIERFAIEKGIALAQFYRLRKRWPELQATYQRAKEIIALRRTELALERDPARWIKYEMPLYSSKHAKLEQWRSKNKSKADEVKIAKEEYAQLTKEILRDYDASK